MESKDSDNISDSQRKRTILSNLLAKLNISGTEAKELLAESSHKRKIQPNISEEVIRRSASSSALINQNIVVKEEPNKSKDDLLSKKSIEGLIELKKKTEDAKSKAKKKPATMTFFDAGASRDITATANKTKEREEIQEEDETQPYKPLILPLPVRADETTLTETFLKEGIDSKDRFFLMQFPRVLPILHINEHNQSFDFFKKMQGKIGKCKVYKSGRIEMIIEGVKYDVNSGVQSKMQQEIAAINKDCKDIYLLNELKKKIVVTPNIQSLLANS